MGIATNGEVWAGIALNGESFAGQALNGEVIFSAVPPGPKEQTVSIFPTAYNSTSWTSPALAVDTSDTTSAYYSNKSTGTVPITLRTFDVSAIPDGAISKIEVIVTTSLSDNTKGSVSATSTLGALSMTQTVAKHSDSTIFTGSFTKAQLSAMTVTVNAVATTKNHTVYLYMVEVKVTYTA